MHTAERSIASQSVAAPAPVNRVVRVAIAGATGYAGQELLRLLARHPAVTVTTATSSGASGSTASAGAAHAAVSAGSSAPAGQARRLPALARLWDGPIVPLAFETLAQEADVVFLALPDGAAAGLAPGLIEAGVRVIDLSGAFRLRDAAERARWYPETHRVPDGIAYGLTERERDAVSRARLVANPGCYPTATLLALAPLETPSERTHFSECHGSISAYGVFNHRHGAEIEEGVTLAARAAGLTSAGQGAINFVPHLVPLDRGILATIYVRVTSRATEDALADIYQRAYRDAPFVRPVGASLPVIKHVAYSNFCDIGWRVHASGRAVLVSVIDNLVKGAAGQAVQNLNVMLGIDERTGLL